MGTLLYFIGGRIDPARSRVEQRSVRVIDLIDSLY